MKENPYRLADDIWGIGFKTADQIAMKLGFDKESFVRLRSGIMYTLSELSSEGHVYLERKQLTEKASELLEAEEDKVNFDGRSVEYDITELDELVHAYATTIHKAQGSEYPIVVMPIMMNHYVMLQRNLIYTGITRAKKALVIIGTKKALSYAVHNVTVTKRNTLLRERLM